MRSHPKQLLARPKRPVTVSPPDQAHGQSVVLTGFLTLPGVGQLSVQLRELHRASLPSWCHRAGSSNHAPECHAEILVNSRIDYYLVTRRQSVCPFLPATCDQINHLQLIAGAKAILTEVSKTCGTGVAAQSVCPKSNCFMSDHRCSAPHPQAQSTPIMHGWQAPRQGYPPGMFRRPQLSAGNACRVPARPPEVS